MIPRPRRPGDKPVYLCPGCETLFDTYAECLAHIKKEHPE